MLVASGAIDSGSNPGGPTIITFILNKKRDYSIISIPQFIAIAEKKACAPTREDVKNITIYSDG